MALFSFTYGSFKNILLVKVKQAEPEGKKVMVLRPRDLKKQIKQLFEVNE